MRVNSDDYDFGGYVTKYNVQCLDGRTLCKNAFADCDGITVPLIWQHVHDTPDVVMGHSLLECRDDGVYGYCKLNKTPAGLNAAEMIANGDINSFSVYANQIKEHNGLVEHGMIREVSLVLAGANPDATIDYLCFQHSDGSLSESDSEAVIHMTDNEQDFDVFNVSAFISHADEDLEEEEDMGDEELDAVASTEASEKTPEEIFNEMTDEQKNVVYMIVAQLTGDNEEVPVEEDVEEEETEDIAQSGIGGNGMKHNVFDSASNGGHTLSHSDIDTIFADAINMGSLKQSVIAHSATYGIDNIDKLFPEYKNVTTTPEFVSRRTEWVNDVLNGVTHSPSSRIRSMHADITGDEARALGYIKGAAKKNEVFNVMKRETSPTTVYKKQKFDRDDITDITDFDLVAWVKSEMRLMLDEEIARAILVGDGREADSGDKIKETSIRPIWTDDPFYAAKLIIPATYTNIEIIDEILNATNEYRGTGVPKLYMASNEVTKLLVTKDGFNHRLYNTTSELGSAMGVDDVVKVPVMNNLTRVIDDDDPTDVISRKLYGIIVNMKDYYTGTDKGGNISMFDDFDIDYNQYKYLLETRLSGCLVKYHSAIVIEIDEHVPYPIFLLNASQEIDYDDFVTEDEDDDEDAGDGPVEV